jgi:hypothetical protein
MATITFSLEEIAEILIANRLLPPEITRARVKGELFHFVIKTGSFVLPYIPASLKYLGFSNNRVTFELTIVSSVVSKAISLLDQALKLKIPSYMKLEYPNIFVDIDRLLQQKNIRNVQVNDILFEDGKFTIVVCNI